MALTLDTETIRLITLFENVTRAPVKDCMIDDESNVAYFIIDEGKAGMAIGRNGNVVKHMEKLTKKTIKIFEFSKDLSLFVKHLIPQTMEVKIRNDDDNVIVEIKVDKKSKGQVIGRDEKNLKLYKELLQRNHKIDNLIVR